MIDIVHEDVFQLCDSREKIGHSPQTVRRWATIGRTGTDGKTYHLETYKNPSGRRCTSVEAIARFTLVLNGVVAHG